MEGDLGTIIFAFALTLFAGLATGIGSFLAFFAKRTNTTILSIALGFSAGVMIYVSFVEIFVKAKDCLTAELGPTAGYWVTILSFFGGMAFIAIIDKLVPSFENPHEIHKAEEMDDPALAENFKKAFVYSFLSGLSEPVGAIIGYALLSAFFNEMIFGVIFASVAGIMVFISFDELLPSAQEYGEHHLTLYGLIMGMIVMAASLVLFS